MSREEIKTIITVGEYYVLDELYESLAKIAKNMNDLKRLVEAATYNTTIEFEDGSSINITSLKGEDPE